ncbi:MAG: hypothetical protein KC897_11335 [Candidatus Omnitrophica bacterium]|nr:hypothetical protein [Candidatus Omnitrophota bacterium]MCB9721735.1 hypothetical protein [Candidatus Omnitrophota bacterium]
MLKPARPYLLSLTVAVLLVGCTAAMSYDQLLSKAKAVNISDGIDRNEAVLLAQRHVILTGLDQDVSVWHVAEVKFLADENTWHVFFRTGLDNKVGDRRWEKIDEVAVAVNAETGSSARIVPQHSVESTGIMP